MLVSPFLIGPSQISDTSGFHGDECTEYLVTSTCYDWIIADYYAVNVAMGKPAYQSESTPVLDTPAGLGTDGEVGNYTFSQLDCAGGTTGGSSLWWYVDLIREYTLGKFKIYGAYDHEGSNYDWYISALRLYMIVFIHDVSTEIIYDSFHTWCQHWDYIW